MTDEWLKSAPRIVDAIGTFMWGPESLDSTYAVTSADPVAAKREAFRVSFADLLATTPGGRAALRALVDPVLVDLVDELPQGEAREAHSEQRLQNRNWGLTSSGWSTFLTIRSDSGRLAGFVALQKPAVGMSAIWMATSGSDTRHLDRTHAVSRANRRPSAILFADLEASTPLSRRMSTQDYFNLARRLVRAADDSVVETGGVVGRHLGDGVTAFFLADVIGSESAAARACIEASRSLRTAVPAIAERSGLAAEDIVLRFGLHWGSTLYVGLFKTIARAEVTAMGDEVNETARIEACASGGRALASKQLIERLTANDAADLGLDRVEYSLLGDLPTATEKARRDAPQLPVTEV
jgi:class 3 adenylate cyclase